MINKVKIGPIVYDVDERDLSDAEIGGIIRYKSSTISIDTNIRTIESKRQVLLHEILHGIINQGKCEDCLVGEKGTEKLIDVLAYGLLGLIQDNPELLEELGGPASFPKESKGNVLHIKSVDPCAVREAVIKGVSLVMGPPEDAEAQGQAE